MTDTRPDPSKPRRGRFRRWIARLLGVYDDATDVDTQAPSPNLRPTITVNRVVTSEFTTPSKGDAYDFTIAVDLCLCAIGQFSADELNAKIDARLPDLKAELMAAARPTAREYPPFRPAFAEPAITAKIDESVEATLAGVPDLGGATLTCNVRVRVDMPNEVRELQRLALAEQVRFDARFEQSELSAQRLGELRETWSKFIRDGLPMWETPYAIHIAQQPAQVASVLFKMRNDRKEEAAQLVDTVAAVAAGHERMDLLEFALATDAALAKTYELLGIATPDNGGVSNFDEPDDARPES